MYQIIVTKRKKDLKRCKDQKREYSKVVFPMTIFTLFVYFFLGVLLLFTYSFQKIGKIIRGTNLTKECILKKDTKISKQFNIYSY